MRVNMADEFQKRAEDAYNSIPEEELKAWANHPMTQCLKYTLMGDGAGYFESWSNGNFTGQSTDETAQLNAKALGGVDALDSLLAWIEDAPRGDLYD